MKDTQWHIQAKTILAMVMEFRRAPKNLLKCQGIHCNKCTSKHLTKIIAAIEKNQPINFVLPAYPGKSPNPEKVLGPLPDLAEEISLEFLNSLCLDIKKIYEPGLKIIVCSDGRVFSDVVGMSETDVSTYQKELKRLIINKSLSCLSTFNLEDYYHHLNFMQMREALMKTFGSSLDLLKTKIRKGASTNASLEAKEANSMYRGITRFLFEDASHKNQIKSRTAIQKEARAKAYEVILRSNAWSQLIEAFFPEAIRLSIHPQTCGSKKLGIRLIGNERWMTPWHGVAVESADGFSLLKRADAEALGAKLIYDQNGRRSHYSLIGVSL